jgi:tetratricopeptide (TPR) repeat protein
MAKKKHTVSRPSALVRVPQQLLSELDEADALIRRKQWTEARELLESLDRRYPNRPEVLGMLVNANYDLKDMHGYQRACERLIKLLPNDPDVTVGLAGAYLTNFRPALALRTFRRFVERWPDDPRAAHAHGTIAELEAAMPELLAEVELSGEEGMRVAILHEEMQSALGQGDAAQVRKISEQLLRLQPEFPPALNNMSQAFFMQSQLDQAIATARRVLAFAEHNVHALSNLTRYLCLKGQVDEAREWGEHLKRAEGPAAEMWLKQAEALSYLGDDEGVLEAFRGAERTGELNPPRGNPLLYHLAAVAALRLGHEAEARRYWQQAFKHAPGMAFVQENLDDLRKPVGERDGPWSFAFGYWLTPKAISDLNTLVVAPAQRKGDQAFAISVRRYLQRHPEVAAVIPLLLDRGDPAARQFALMAAKTAQTPELLAALRDFALGQRGPDNLRHQAAQAADEAGLFPDRRVRMWLKGEWRELILMGFEISGEAENPLGPKVAPLMSKAMEALHARQGAKAEQLLEQAIVLGPDEPSLLNNLALAYEQQGRHAEAEALTREIHERFPDYLFARIALARLHMRDGDLDAAEELIKPLLARRKLHYIEATALFGAQVDLSIAQGNTDAARTWLDIWAGMDQDNPEIARRRLILEAGGRIRKLFGRRR